MCHSGWSLGLPRTEGMADGAVANSSHRDHVSQLGNCRKLSDALALSANAEQHDQP